MSCVVFLRGVNVGGNKSFRPSALAAALARHDVVSVGAAGTLVVGGKVGAAVLRAAIARLLPFDAKALICPAREILALLDDPPATPEGATLYLSVLEKRPRPPPALPIEEPPGRDWQVKLFALRGRYALSLHRGAGKALIYPNEVVEKRTGLAATTRNWSTLERIGALL